MNANELALARIRAYNAPVLQKTGHEIGNLEWSGQEPQCAMQAAFFMLWCAQLWATGREEPQGSPVLHRYFRLSLRSPAQSEIGLAVNNR